MIFSSLTFLIFMVVVLALFRALPSDRARRRMLLAASYVFYGWWDWRFLALIAGSSTWSWFCGNQVADSTLPARRRRWLILGLCGDLGSLAFFKYAQFFVDSAIAALGLPEAGALGIVLPVGISFFTFQSMSYTIDVYRGTLKPCRDLERFLLFVSFFPQLVAGPIVRASEFLPQLHRPLGTDAGQIARGLQIFVIGLFQKVVIADNVSLFVDPVFADPARWHALTLWAGMFAYALQILCDFSGYSLMAIGTARMLGFKLPDNFRMPYLATSITDFWRRWHMSLSRWLRDYLYISLGGNRRGRRRTHFNLAMTMLLGGLWHGAGWNFVLWGAGHGIGLFVHKMWRERLGDDAGGRLRAVAGWAVTLLFCLLLWVPFRCADWATTLTYFHGLFVPKDAVLWLHTPSMLLLGVGAAWHLLRLAEHASMDVLPDERPFAWRPLTVAAGLALAALMFAPQDASPFIYFQF